MTDASRLRTTTATSLLDDSCRIEPASSAVGLRELMREKLRLAPAASVVLLVTGGALPLAEVRSVQTVLPPEVSLIAFRAQHGAEARIARVGHTTVATIGELGELPAVLRRVRP